MPTEAMVLLDFTTEELRAELARSLEITAVQMVRLAAIVGELERRGEDLSGLRVGLLGYLRRIAAGQVLPELVVRYQGRPAVLRIAANLPLGDQRRLIASDTLDLVVPGPGEKGWDVRQIKPEWLRGPQLRQLIGPESLRTQAEQIVLLEGLKGGHRPAAKGRAPRFGRCVPDALKGGLRVGKTFLPAADLVAALAALQGPQADDDAPADSPVNLRLTEAQHTSLKLAATRGGTDMQTLTRRALAAFGLFGHS